MSERTEVEKQIEAAFDYRGHVTITFVNGETLVGFIFNRAFSTPKHPVEPFIEVHPKGSDAAKKFLMSEVRSVALTGGRRRQFLRGLSQERKARPSGCPGKFEHPHPIPKSFAEISIIYIVQTM